MGSRNLFILIFTIMFGLLASAADEKHAGAGATTTTHTPDATEQARLVPTVSNHCPGVGAKQDLSNAPIFVNINGKGIHAPWDIGVVKAAFEDIPAMKGANVQLGGNSSGSLLATYFACWGINAQTIADLEKVFENTDGGEEYDFNLINSSTAKKKIRMYSQIKTENSHDDIRPLIQKMLNRNGQKCNLNPNVPLIIAAANRDLIDARVFHKVDKTGAMVPDENGKPIETTGPALYTYNEKGKVYHPETNSISLNGKNLGKACTQFVTKASFDELSKIPYEKRECELRMIENFEDLELAMLASVAEPTYFDHVKEKNPGKIRGSGVADHAEREYVGGFLNSNLAIDRKNQNPELYVLSTGVTPFTDKQEHILKGWFMINPTERLLAGKKVVDLEVLPEIDWNGDEVLDAHQMFEAGYKHAKEAFAKRAKECKDGIIPTPNSMIKIESIKK